VVAGDNLAAVGIGAFALVNQPLDVDLLRCCPARGARAAATGLFGSDNDRLAAARSILAGSVALEVAARERLVPGRGAQRDGDTVRQLLAVADTLGDVGGLDGARVPRRVVDARQVILVVGVVLDRTDRS
jgi:hypothetical protein